MGMVAAQLGWSEKLSGAPGGTCDIALDDREIKELLRIKFERLPGGWSAELDAEQVELLNPYVPVVLDTDLYSYGMWIPDDYAPYGC
jgi:hypothetical protein